MDYKKLREEMVTRQLISRGIRDKKVLEAFLSVPREEFVPPAVQEDAYGDFPISIGEGQTISQPYMVALMTECLELKGDEKVLEIGTGSGYQAAILSELTQEVYTVERIPSLACRAEETLKKLGYTNVKVFIRNGTEGLEEYAPYTHIIVTAAAKEIPSPLTRQLSEGGKMVIPVGNAFSQELELIEKREGELMARKVERCVFVPLVGKYGWGRRK